MPYLGTVLLAMAYILGGVKGETTSPILVSDPQGWPSGFKMMIRFQLLDDVGGGWTMTLRFSKPAPNLQIWRAAIVDSSSDNTVYNLTNMSWNEDLSKCFVFEAAFIAEKDPGTDAPTATLEFRRKTVDEGDLDRNACPTTLPPTTSVPVTTEPTTSVPVTTEPTSSPQTAEPTSSPQTAEPTSSPQTAEPESPPPPSAQPPPPSVNP